MKKLLFFLCLLPCLVFADNEGSQGTLNSGSQGAPNAKDPVNFSISDLGSGMYSYPSANEIPDNAASYIQNFFTDIQPLAVERNGTVAEESTILGSTKAVTGLWDFVDVSGIEWLIAFSSQTFYKKQFGTSFVPFGPQITTTNQVYATNNLGKIWFVDGVDSLWSFDGTSTATISGAPIGKYISSWRNHLAIGCIVGSQSTVWFSKDGDGTTWTIGAGDSDPFTIQVGGANDGYAINCLYGMYQDNLIIGRKFDTWAMYGFTQSDEQTRKITSEIGCLQNGTMKESDGDLMWLSNRGIERMNASAITLVSDPIRDITDSVVKNTGNTRSNLQDDASDWLFGSADNTYYIDTISFPGDVRPTFPDYFIAFRDGTLGSKNVWTNYCVNTVVGCSTNAFVTTNILAMGSNNGTDQIVRTSGQIINYAQGTTFYFQVPSMTGNSNPTGENFDFLISSIAATSTSFPNIPSNLNNEFDFSFVSTGVVGGPNFSLQTVSSSSDLTLCSNCQTVAALIPTTVAVWISTTHWSVSTGGITVAQGVHTFPNYSGVYAYLEYTYNPAVQGNIYISSFNVVPETATYTSQLLNIGTVISKWGPAFITDSKSGTGNITYQFGSTSSAIIGNISNYATLTNGGTPTAVVNPFAAFNAKFNILSVNDTLALASFLTVWTEGSSPANTAWTWDRRYWISLTTATSSNPTLNSILVYQRNKTWTTLNGINAASFTRWKDGLYYGDSTATGLVYNYDTGNSDNGNAITSEIITKSYDAGRAFRDKDFRKMYTGYQGSSGFTGAINLTYDVERSGNAFPLGSANLSDFNGLNEAKFPFPLNTSPTQGREIQYTLMKSGTGDRLKLYEMRTMYYLKEAR